MSSSSPSGDSIAKTLIKDLIDSHCDFTLLFHLRQVSALEDTSIGEQLNLFLSRHRLQLSHFIPTPHNAPFLNTFFQEVRSSLSQEGIVPISPQNMLIECNKNGKLRILERYQEATKTWPRPHQPYCIQTMGSSEVLFMLFQTWQDAMLMQRDILDVGGYTFEGRMIEVHQVYEHQWTALNMPVRLMIDWEIMFSQYEDRISLEQALQIPEEFPLWLVNRLRVVRAIEPNVVVECIVKDKTRKKGGGDTKISKHFIFNILSPTFRGHYQALCQAIEPWLLKIKTIQKEKSLASLSDSELSSPAWGWDSRLLRGQNGIGTLFGRKPGDV